MSKESIIRRRKAFVLPLDDSHLIAIGHIAVRAAMLDTLINLTFEQVLKRYPEQVRSELAKVSTPKKINIIKEALIQDLPEDAKGISDFISEIFSVRDERNDIMHRIWRATDTPEMKAIVEIVHDKPEIEKRRVTAVSMSKTATQILDLAIELGDWKMRVNSVHRRRRGASPDNPARPEYLRPSPRPSPPGRTGKTR